MLVGCCDVDGARVCQLVHRILQIIVHCGTDNTVLQEHMLNVRSILHQAVSKLLKSECALTATSVCTLFPFACEGNCDDLPRKHETLRLIGRMNA